MGIFSRLNDIVNANILHMLDKAEDPEKMVRLMIQEMEDTLVEVKTSAAKIISDQKAFERQIAYLQREEAEWEEKAELAVRKGRDDLARAALLEKGKRGKTRAELEEQLQNSQESLKHFREDIKNLDAKLHDTKIRQKAIISRKRAAQGQLEIQRHLGSLNSGKVVAKFEQYERDLDRLEGLVTTFKSSSEAEELEREIEKLKTDGEIDSELQALKQKVRPTEESV